MNALPRFWILALIVACLGMTRGTRGDQQETQIDTHEGSTVRLQCRFPPINNPNSRTTSPPFFWWLAHTNNFHDNAAINNSPLGLQYRVNLDLEKGIYDLEIHNVSYARDNGKYECRVKQGDTGDSLYHKNITLTVLRAPGPPTISPVSAIAKEGEKLELSCNSFGGSPEPEVRWYRGSSNQPIHSGKTYVIIPSKEDDRDELRCVVRNRAMPPGQTLSASVTLDVHYYPRVTVNTDTLRVEVNSIATLRCRVDSKPAVGSVRWIRDGRFVATSFNHTLSKISLQDAGKYTCMADNGLPKKGEASVFLNVLYPPQVFIEGERLRTAEVGDNIVVRCNVTANPPPDSIEWLRDGKPEFRVTDPTLRLSRVTAEHAGNYTCRAINSIHPTGAERSKNHSASSRVEIRVRHKPGPARITPDSPVAVEGSKVILTCIANPPGYPEAQFKWYKEGEVYRRPNGNEHMDSRLEINSVNLNSEGTYQCRAFNEIGDGEETKVNLTVNLAPKILSKLQPHVTRKVGESSFQVSCVAQGKPRPTVRWLKDDRELTADQSRYKVTTIPSDGRVVTVNSTLSFLGNARPETDRIIADDRGKYTCVVENEVKHVESQMMLKVEHAPIPLNVYDKVANNKGETASVTCKVQAWPKPEFQWSFGANQATLQGSSSDGHYEISTTSDNYDVHTSVLKITNIRDNDYGDYSCRALNTQGFITSAITLQAKGAPERPINVRAMDVGPTHVVLIWDLGFDGGLPVSKYFISYKKVAGGDDIIAPDCAPSQSTPSGQWQEIECRQFNPCNVSNLEQHQSYAFKVKVYNPAGHSDYSEEVTATTAVAKIPSPAGVRYDPDGNTLGISVGPTCLALVAFIEKSDSGSSNTWRQVDNWPLDVLGGQSTQREGVLEDPHASSSEPRIRVRLCLKADSARCGEYVEAELGPSFIAHAGALGTPTLIAIVVSSAVFLLFGALLLLFCRCFRRKHAAKAKDYEMDSNAVRPSLVTGNGQQTQAPPPYYAENKALEHSLDHALAMEDSKSPAYGQTGYGYHQPNHNINGVNMGYMENSYSNSNNGGSVNSQDSIWQMKTAAANGVGVNAGNVGVVGTPYDMGGYGITEPDYSCQPQYMPQHTADYRDSHNLSRQQFIEPYPPATLKAQKHMDSPYDVSGLPYQETYDEEVKPPQQVSLSYDESLESGYSTPNSRGRRIIREIIV